MEEEKLLELFDQFRKDPKLREALEVSGIPDDPEESVRKLAGLAKEFGYALSEEDIHAAASIAEKQRKAMTKKTMEEVERLSDDDLDRVAGGGDKPSCKDTYQDKENCWSTDGCDQTYNIYPGYKCYCNEEGGKIPECGGFFAVNLCQTLFFPDCPDHYA